MLGLECSTVCSSDADVDSERRRLEVFEMWIWRTMEKISWLDKVTIEKVLKTVNENRQILNSIWQRKRRRFGHVSRHDGLLHEILEGRMKGKPTRGRRRIQMLHDLAKDGGLLHSNGQLRTERYGDRWKGCQLRAVYSRRLLMMK